MEEWKKSSRIIASSAPGKDYIIVISIISTAFIFSKKITENQKNEEFVQQGFTNAMLWSIDEIIAYVSQFFTLKKGDILFTGTPEGVGKVSADDVLTGFLNKEQVFTLRVR